MFSEYFVGQESATPQRQQLAINTGRLLVYHNPEAGRAEQGGDHLEELESDFEVHHIFSTSPDPFTNADNLAREIYPSIYPNPKAPKFDLIVISGGDSTAWTGIHGLYRAAEEHPELLDIPFAFLANGSGNDVALSASTHRDLRKMISQGWLIEYRPPLTTITKPDGSVTSHYAGANVAVGVPADAAHSFNSPEVHGHKHFKDPLWRDYLLLKAGAKGVLKSHRFVMEEMDSDGDFGPERLVFSRAFFHGLRFGIHGRTASNFEDPYLREAILPSKYGLKTAAYAGAFVGGRMGLKIPSHIIEGPRAFRVKPRKDSYIVRYNIDDTDDELEPESIVQVELAKMSGRLLVTR